MPLARPCGSPSARQGLAEARIGEPVSQTCLPLSPRDQVGIISQWRQLLFLGGMPSPHDTLYGRKCCSASMRPRAQDSRRAARAKVGGAVIPGVRAACRYQAAPLATNRGGIIICVEPAQPQRRLRVAAQFRYQEQLTASVATVRLQLRMIQKQHP